MKNIYVFGHRNPDTDSVCSSIALAYLKNELGHKAVPKILSDVNKETDFVLNYFNIKKPEYINDIKVRIKDVKYEKNLVIDSNLSIMEGYQKMSDNHTTAIPLVDENKKLTGYVTLKEITKYLFSNHKQYLNTSLENITKTLNAKVLVKNSDYIEGKVAVAGLDNSTFNDEIKVSEYDIIVLGNRPKILSHAINNDVKLIILSFGSKIDKKLLKKAEKNNVTIIRTELDSFNIANKIGAANSIKTINTNKSPVVVYDEDFYLDFINKKHKANHTNFPVVNKKGECLGLIRITGSNKYNKQRVILVDHNSFAQSAVGIEEAEILEIVDHHNLGAIGTTSPINFRSMIVGCTSTIIYNMFLENKITIPKDIAGIMLSAIISDTLLFTSPTCTKFDKQVAEKLAKIAKINVTNYGNEMLKAGSSLVGMSVKDIIYSDYKSFEMNNKKIGISIVLTTDFETMKDKTPEIVEYLDSKIENGYDLSVMFVTDIIKNGSYIIYNSEAEEIIKESFSIKNIHQGIFVKELISRKKQMLPSILDTMGL